MATMVVIPFTFADVEATKTDNILGTNDKDREIQASPGATAIAADRSPYINDVEPSVPQTSYERRDTTPLEAAEQQGTNRTHSTFNTGCSDELLTLLLNVRDRLVRQRLHLP